MNPPIKLHLGCGGRRLDGYVHIDARDLPGLDYVATVDELNAFEDNSVDLIYACHVFEHIKRPAQLGILRYWRRKLKSGGTLRLSVPDFATLSELYLEWGVTFWRIVGPLYGRQDYPENVHYCGFDHEYLAWLLTEAGFHTIRRWWPYEVFPVDYDDYSKAKIEHAEISLNLEATA